jgi:hypothetical protein
MRDEDGWGCAGGSLGDGGGESLAHRGTRG